MRPTPSRLPSFRRPPLRVIAAIVLAMLAALLVHRATTAAAATAARYGTLVPVVVATDELLPGDVVDGNVRVDRWPIAFVPADALTEVPVGQVVVGRVGAGEALTTARVGSEKEGVAALVPIGWRAVAVPIWDAALPVLVGDHVDVIVVDPSTARPLVVASGAIVVHVAGDDAVTVAVPARESPVVAAAIVSGAVTLALVG